MLHEEAKSTYHVLWQVWQHSMIEFLCWCSFNFQLRLKIRNLKKKSMVILDSGCKKQTSRCKIMNLKLLALAVLDQLNKTSCLPWPKERKKHGFTSIPPFYALRIRNIRRTKPMWQAAISMWQVAKSTWKEVTEIHNYKQALQHFLTRDKGFLAISSSLLICTSDRDM